MLKKYSGKTILSIILCLATCLSLVGCGAKEPQPEPLSPLEVSILRVGKADVIVLISGEEVMVIDAGEEEDGEELIEFLSQQGLSHIDTLIITHFDRDHVGGGDSVVEELLIGQVIIPDYEGVNPEYSDFMDSLQEKNITPVALTEPMEFTFGESKVTVEPPLSYDLSNEKGENDNNFSLITTVVHGENRLIFTGDAEKQRIREWLSQGTAAPCKFLKMPHHGVYNSALKDLLEATTPEFAVICSSNKHPADEKTLELLKEYKVNAKQTKDGDVSITSDGYKIEIHQKLEH
ncbi:MAG: MBL fold metallo-hydrolase [Oscillospiraceae bacterium]